MVLWLFCQHFLDVFTIFHHLFCMHNNYKSISKMLLKYFRQSHTTGNFSFLKKCVTCIYNNQTIEWFNNLGVTQFCESLKHNLSLTDIFKYLYNQVFPWQPFLILNAVIRSVSAPSLYRPAVWLYINSGIQALSITCINKKSSVFYS